ncbi:hypothetical protein [Pedobacter mendelii]|uniref:Lipocalin-like domain-containing protein n=1 Tax=Pedobacter mendelii TaxID=1908240 RepID=A0ABQ2BHX5_9SPHI|nr:hypothetical protein [Pedobacter mendelii]GGI26518.1 hypothetical protein GCM10008119_23050 [Pedobacter mendelii]
MKNKKNFILMKGTVMLLFVCAILSCGSQTADYEKKIIGSWVGEIKLPNNGKSIGNMHLEFTREGAFFQTTGEGAEKVVSKQTYRITKNKIFYKGKATGNEELDSDYHFRGDVLVMQVDADSAEYRRVK